MTTEVTIDLDDAREVMYDELCDSIGEGRVRELLADTATDVVTEAYDNREQLQRQVEAQQAQQ